MKKIEDLTKPCFILTFKSTKDFGYGYHFINKLKEAAKKYSSLGSLIFGDESAGRVGDITELDSLRIAVDYTEPKDFTGNMITHWRNAESAALITVLKRDGVDATSENYIPDTKEAEAGDVKIKVLKHGIIIGLLRIDKNRVGYLNFVHENTHMPVYLSHHKREVDFLVKKASEFCDEVNAGVMDGNNEHAPANYKEFDVKPELVN